MGWYRQSGLSLQQITDLAEERFLSRRSRRSRRCRLFLLLQLVERANKHEDGKRDDRERDELVEEDSIIDRDAPAS